MITERIDPDEEFYNPNINYDILMSKLKNRILDLENDLLVVSDPKVQTFIQDEVISLRKEYFNYLKIDLELQHLVLSNPDVYGEEKNENI